MTIIDETSAQSTAVGPDEVKNLRGVVIGRVLAPDAAVDHREFASGM